MDEVMSATTDESLSAVAAVAADDVVDIILRGLAAPEPDPEG